MISYRELSKNEKSNLRAKYQTHVGASHVAFCKHHDLDFETRTALYAMRAADTLVYLERRGYIVIDEAIAEARKRDKK